MASSTGSLITLFDTEFLTDLLTSIGNEVPEKELVLHVGAVKSWPLQLYRGRNAAMIFNTDYENEPGEHWVAVYINGQTKTAFCFDSMPLRPFPSEIRSNLCKICDRVLMVNRNGFVVQHPDYPLCGLYCLFFLEHYSKDFDFNLTPDNLLYNDIRVLAHMMPFVCKTLKK